MANFTENRLLNTTRTQAQATVAVEQPKADVWLNIGVRAADGETIVQLPQGIALDTMQERKIFNLGSDATEDQLKGKKVGEASNHLLHMLQQLASEVNPGESLEVEIPFVVSIRRVSNKANTETFSSSELEDFLGIKI